MRIPFVAGVLGGLVVTVTATVTVTAQADAAAVAPALPGNVVVLDAASWNDASRSSLTGPARTPLTAVERAAVLRTLPTLPAFPGSPYSGCHARAHFTYEKLATVGGGKLFKVWLFSMQTLAPALHGRIVYRAPGGETSWGYHVAAAFVDEQGATWVVDTLLGRAPLALADWLGRFQIEGAAVLTYLPGEKYLFNKTEVPAVDPVKFPDGLRQSFLARNVMNGAFYEYVGDAARDHEGARDLAADALSEALQNNAFPGCPWQAQATSSLELKKLAAPKPAKGGAAPAVMPAACQKAAQLFATEVERWTRAGL